MGGKQARHGNRSGLRIPPFIDAHELKTLSHSRIQEVGNLVPMNRHEDRSTGFGIGEMSLTALPLTVRVHFTNEELPAGAQHASGFTKNMIQGFHVFEHQHANDQIVAVAAEGPSKPEILEHEVDVARAHIGHGM